MIFLSSNFTRARETAQETLKVNIEDVYIYMFSLHFVLRVLINWFYIMVFQFRSIFLLFYFSVFINLFIFKLLLFSTFSIFIFNISSVKTRFFLLHWRIQNTRIMLHFKICTCLHFLFACFFCMLQAMLNIIEFEEEPFRKYVAEVYVPDNTESSSRSAKTTVSTVISDIHLPDININR